MNNTLFRNFNLIFLLLDFGCNVLQNRQVERDCEFLEAERIMDYSLLVGIHFRDDNTGDKMGLSPFVLRGMNFLLCMYLDFNELKIKCELTKLGNFLFQAKGIHIGMRNTCVDAVSSKQNYRIWTVFLLEGVFSALDHSTV